MSISRAPQNVALALILAASVSIPLANAEPGERGARRGGPPQEAFEACVGKVEGDACSFSGRRGEAEGTCFIPPHDEEALVCAPADGPRQLEPPNDREAE